MPEDTPTPTTPNNDAVPTAAPDAAPLTTDAPTEAPVTSPVFGSALTDETAPAPVVDPIATPEATEPTGSVPETTPTQSAKKPALIVGIIIAVAVVLLGGGSASAYFLWYQNPEKAVFDGLMSATESKTLSFTASLDSETTGSSTYAVKVDGKVSEDAAVEMNIDATVQSKGTADLAVKGAVIADKDGNLFIKVSELRKLLDTTLGGDYTEYIQLFDTVITKLDDKWIKVSSDDLKDVSQDYSEQQKCLADAQKSIGTEASNRDELIALFKKNKFIVVGDSIGSKSIKGVSSTGYTLTLDKDKFVSFVQGIADTKIGKALKACDSSYDFSKLDASSLGLDKESTQKSELQIWVSTIGHQITEFNLTANGDDGTGKIVIQPTFDAKVSVQSPTPFVTVKEITDDIQAAVNKAYAQ